MVPLPPLRITYSGLFIGAGLGLLAAKAALFRDPHGFLENFAGDLLGVLAGVLFAAGGINELARFIQRRAWKRQTAPLVLELINQISDELVRLAQDAFRIVVPAIPPGFANPVAPDVDWDVPSAIRVSSTWSQAVTYERLQETIDVARNGLYERQLDSSAHERVVAAATELVDQMESRADDLKARIGELAPYREPEAPRLIQEASDLAGRTLDLKNHTLSQDEPGGDTQVGGDRATWIATGAATVLTGCHALKEPLDDAYRDVVRTLDPALARHEWPSSDKW